MGKHSNWDGIVKVQRAVSGEDLILVYNEDRSIQFQTIRTKAHTRMFKKDEYKIYVHAHMKGTYLIFRDRAPHQEW
jgi:hypothetical protein